MPRGIEHRTTETIMQAYEYYELNKWAIYAGKEQVMCYEEDNIDDSKSKLENVLTAIEESGTGTIYTLRFYSDSVGEITSKTPNKGSTTFMFGDRVTKQENGITVIDRKGQAEIRSLGTSLLQERITRLESELQKETERRHLAELANLRNEFNSKISGLTAEDKPDRIERIVGAIIEKPEALDKALAHIGTWLEKFFTKPVPAMQPAPVMTPYQPGPAINGTAAVAEEKIPEEKIFTQSTFIMNDEKTTESANTVAAENEQNATAQELDDRLDDALDEIEEKIGTVAMVRALEALAEKDRAALEALIALL